MLLEALRKQDVLAAMGPDSAFAKFYLEEMERVGPDLFQGKYGERFTALNYAIALKFLSLLNKRIKDGFAVKVDPFQKYYLIFYEHSYISRKKLKSKLSKEGKVWFSALLKLTSFDQFLWWVAQYTTRFEIEVTRIIQEKIENTP